MDMEKTSKELLVLQASVHTAGSAFSSNVGNLRTGEESQLRPLEMHLGAILEGGMYD